MIVTKKRDYRVQKLIERTNEHSSKSWNKFVKIGNYFILPHNSKLYGK